jgi:hypothetical protein
VKRTTAKRELIAPRGDKRYIRRDEKGRIKESDDQGKSLSQDRRRKAMTAATPGAGRSWRQEGLGKGRAQVDCFLEPPHATACV